MKSLSKKEFSERIVEHGKKYGVSEEVYLDEAKSLQGVHLTPTGEIFST